MIITKIRQIYPLCLFFLMLFTSCISDDYDSCYGVRLTINYPNDQERCEKLDIYVFDQQGALFAKYEKTGRQVQPGVSYLLQVPEGQYNIVVWGDVGGIYSYQFDSASKSLDQKDQSLATADFWRHRVVADIKKRAAGVISENLKPLFYASAYQVDLKAKEAKTIDLNLIKNTNKIKLKVSGLPDGVSYDLLNVGITASNWQYHFTNLIPMNTEEIRYEPHARRVEVSSADGEKSVVADWSVLRLIKGRTPQLYVKNGETGDILFQRNLIELLLNLPYTDLDKEDYFEIEMDFRGPTISIKINDWDVVDNN